MVSLGRLDPDEASLVLIPVPWEATVSFGQGTANAPDAIRTKPSTRCGDISLYQTLHSWYCYVWNW